MTRMHGPTAIWLWLMIVTLASFGTAQAGGGAFALVMLAATVKALLIVRNYMELRFAPLEWRLMFHALIGASGAVIVGLHFLA